MSVGTSIGTGLSHRWLTVDATRETERIADAIRAQVSQTLRRRGVVLGLSGGIDSSVCAALCVRALGAERVIGLLMPEADSADETTAFGRLIGEHLGIRTILEDITSVLDAAGCYRRRDEAIAKLLPHYGPGFKSKLVLSGPTESTSPADGYNVFSIVVEAPDGAQSRARLSADAYLSVVAATNFKQRVRKMMEYHYADRFQYAVVGTSNLLEQDQGFFVKNGDGAADLKPISHLYKSQVYRLAEHLGIPGDVLRRPPTTDTFSLAQSQEEFFFAIPLEKLDLCLFGVNHAIPAVDVAAECGLSPAQVERVYRDIESKRRATAHLHMPPLVVGDEARGR